MLRGHGPSRFAGMALHALRAWSLVGLVIRGPGLSGPYSDERGLLGLGPFHAQGLQWHGLLKLKIQLF